MDQLELFSEQDKQPEGGELKQIRTYLHVWNAAERKKRIHAAAASSGMADNSGQISRQCVMSSRSGNASNGSVGLPIEVKS